MTKHDSMIRDLTTGSVFRQLIAFSLPLILSNFLQTAYNLVDSSIVGRYVGAEGLAAVVATGDIMNLFTLLCMGFGAAGQIIIAQQVGRKTPDAIRATIGTLFTVLFLLSMAVTVFFFLATEWMVRALNIPADSVDYAVRYLTVCGAGMVFVYGYNAVSCVLRGMGESKKPLIFVAIAAGLNCVLDVVFIVFCGWDTMGAALATVIGQGVSFLVSMVYLYRRRDSFGFDFKLRSFYPDRTSLGLIMKVGIPQAVQYAALLLSMLYVTSCINRYGVAAAAVNGVAGKLEGVCRVVANSMATAGSAIIAQCIGAGKLDRCKKTLLSIFWVSLVYCSVCAVCIGLFPRQVFALFSTDEAVLALAQEFALVGVVICYGHVLRNTFMPIINGVGFGTLSLAIGLLDGVIGRIGLSLLLGVGLNMGLMGFWWGNCLAGYITVFIAGGYYLSGKWKTYKLLH